jgi:hypothetical protein
MARLMSDSSPGRSGAVTVTSAAVLSSVRTHSTDARVPALTPSPTSFHSRKRVHSPLSRTPAPATKLAGRRRWREGAGDKPPPTPCCWLHAALPGGACLALLCGQPGVPAACLAGGESSAGGAGGAHIRRGPEMAAPAWQRRGVSTDTLCGCGCVSKAVHPAVLCVTVPWVNSRQALHGGLHPSTVCRSHAVRLQHGAGDAQPPWRVCQGVAWTARWR